MKRITKLTVELTAGQAAGLRRFADKVSHDHCLSVLYPHVSRDIRADQVSDILSAFNIIEKALADAGVSSFPWIDTGEA